MIRYSPNKKGGHNMNSISTSVLEDIDQIVLESTIDVYEALSHEYEKAVKIFSESSDENIHPGISLFQEENVFDYATGKHTGDSTFMKIVMFIPRLFIGIIRAIGSIFTKDFKSKNDESMKTAGYVIDHSSPEQLTVVANEVNNTSKGDISFDPNQKNFNIGRKFRHIRNSIAIMVMAPKVIKNIITQCRSGNTDYKLLAKDLWSILKREKKMDEVTEKLTLDALKSLVNESWQASIAVAALSDEASALLEKKMRKDFAKGKNIEKQAEAKELFDGITQFSRHVTHVTGFCTLVKKITALFKGFDKIKNNIKVARGTQDANDELFNAKQKNKVIDYEIEGLENEEKLEEKIEKKNEKLDKKIEKQNKRTEKLKKKKRSLLNRLGRNNEDEDEGDDSE